MRLNWKRIKKETLSFSSLFPLQHHYMFVPTTISYFFGTSVTSRHDYVLLLFFYAYPSIFSH